MCFVVSLLLARRVIRLLADVPAFEAEKRTSGRQADARPGPAGRTKLELLGAEPLMQIEIRHRCGRRADLPIVRPRRCKWQWAERPISRGERPYAIYLPRATVTQPTRKPACSSGFSSGRTWDRTRRARSPHSATLDHYAAHLRGKSGRPAIGDIHSQQLSTTSRVVRRWTNRRSRPAGYPSRLSPYNRNAPVNVSVNPSPDGKTQKSPWPRSVA
jgi:hypothetical protein